MIIYLSIETAVTLLIHFLHFSSFTPSELPRRVSFSVTDMEGASSEEAIARVIFSAIDNKPTLDLNGPELPGQDTSVEYREGDPPVMVSG